VKKNAKMESAGPHMMLTIKEACAEMRISESQLYVLMKADELHSIPVGPRGKRIPRTEIEAYITRKLAEQAESLKAAS
jgi:excisionase family DNA binding protein